LERLMIADLPEVFSWKGATPTTTGPQCLGATGATVPKCQSAKVPTRT
jgi:hypothetical protein